jgi:hypothetical protein
MFVLRQRHLEAFNQTAMESFEDRILPVLYDKFPDECEQLGEQRVRGRIRRGVERAARATGRRVCRSA